MPSLAGNDDGSGFGVQGKSATGTGVVGDGPQWAGVVGSSVSGSGVSAFSDSGAGVLSVSNSGIGVSGESVQGAGVSGKSTDGVGIIAESVSAVGVSGTSRLDNGVFGTTEHSGSSGVFGRNTASQDGNGVVGIAEGLGGIGVFGSAETRGVGVVGNGATGVLAQGDARPGVQASSKQDHGVHGIAEREGFAGVYGVHHSKGDGVRGEGETGIRGEGNNGVLGLATTSNMLGAGVRGENPVLGAAGVMGLAPNGCGVVGLSGQVSAAGMMVPLFSSRAGVVGVSDQGPGVLGQGVGSHPGVFAFGTPAITTFGDIGAIGNIGALGDVTVIGTLKATNKQFQIDHPLDPSNKYLNHASVESSEMKTIYDGVAVLDDQGQAVVELPAWFESLNTDFRYQLTPIGAPAPDLHIAEEVSTNRFKIAGGPARLKVCWQVTGVRHDSFARARPLAVETDKPVEERGYFLHPEDHGHPRERGIAWARNGDLIRRVEELRAPSGD
jgi:hypothetical protein